MKKLLCAVLAILMLFSLAACGKAKKTDADPKTTEPAAAETAKPAEPDETQAPDDASAYVTGGVDYCEELKPGRVYYFDLDGDCLGDRVELRDGAELNTWCSTYLKVTFGAYPDYPAIWEAPEDCTIWVIDSDPEDGCLEILETDDGASDDPESTLLVADRRGNGFTEVYGPGIRIDAEHPFSTANGFPVVDWTQLMGTSVITGRMRAAYNWETGWYFERVGDAFYYEDYYAVARYKLKNDLEVNVLNEDGSVGEKLTLSAGDTVSPYSTDNSSFVVLRLADGRLAKAAAEKRSWPDSGSVLFPWAIGGVWQDLLMDLTYSG